MQRIPPQIIQFIPRAAGSALQTTQTARPSPAASNAPHAAGLPGAQQSTLGRMQSRGIITSTTQVPEDAVHVGFHGTSARRGKSIMEHGVRLEESGVHGEPALGAASFSVTPDKDTAAVYARRAARTDRDDNGMILAVYRAADARPERIETASRPPVPEIARQMRAAAPEAHEFATSLQADGTHAEIALLERAAADAGVAYYVAPEDEFKIDGAPQQERPSTA